MSLEEGGPEVEKKFRCYVKQNSEHINIPEGTKVYGSGGFKNLEKSVCISAAIRRRQG